MSRVEVETFMDSVVVSKNMVRDVTILRAHSHDHASDAPGPPGSVDQNHGDGARQSFK